MSAPIRVGDTVLLLADVGVFETPVLSVSQTAGDAWFVQVKVDADHYQWLPLSDALNVPREGVDRCDCGAKYWEHEDEDVWFCASCFSLFRGRK